MERQARARRHSRSRPIQGRGRTARWLFAATPYLKYLLQQIRRFDLDQFAHITAADGENGDCVTVPGQVHDIASLQRGGMDRLIIAAWCCARSNGLKH